MRERAVQAVTVIPNPDTREGICALDDAARVIRALPVTPEKP